VDHEFSQRNPGSSTGEDQQTSTGFVFGRAAGLPGLFHIFAAGDWGWIKGWLFIGVFLACTTVALWYVWRANPEVVAARISSHPGTKSWDKTLLAFFFPLLAAIAPVAALDDERFHWFPLPWWVCGVGYAFFLIGTVIITWAQSVNKFFERTVRIQTDRGQKVIDTGPYAIVRHPGYVAGIFWFLGMALCLTSLWALLPAGLAWGLLILRTQWEDQTLQAELPGYKEYRERVRYRMIPGVW
jgi:protein-S-isoprenylcysteine O-methyltransferase Ste14